MADILKRFAPVVKYLDGMSVYEIRNIARAVGVRSPTTAKKGELIEQIVGVEAGIVEPAGKATNKGAPTKGAQIPQEVLAEIRRRIGEVKKREMPYPEPDEEEAEGFKIQFADPQGVGHSYDDDCYAGILEIYPQGYGFMRAENCEPGKGDVFVAAPVIRKFRLKSGDFLSGYVRQNRESGSPALEELAAVNGRHPSEAARKDFDDMTPRYPEEQIVLGKSGKLSLRCIDLMSPIGKGQRGLIVSPPKAGKTTLLKDIAKAICDDHPGIHLIILLVDERPEEVTDMRENIRGAEIVYSTFDETAEHHTGVASLILDRAKRLAEGGRDVVILLDSITKLARAYNTTAVPSGKILSGGIDPAALTPPKKFFGAARNFGRGQGSLTILATALVDTGSRMDDVIYEEFKGTGNMEIHLSREMAERRVFPAIDVFRSGTRKEELLLDKDALECARTLRKSFNRENAAETLFSLMERTKDNRELAARAGEFAKTYKVQR